MMEILISKLKVDPEQPRQSKWTKEIHELADNIKEHGIINPIEVDENNMIVTGERRFLACKRLNLKTVPCRIIKNLTSEKRFLRQLSENVHQMQMAPLDEAKAFKRAIDSRFGGVIRKSDEGIRWLAEQIGKSTTLVSDRLLLLGQSEKFQDAVEDKKIPASAVRVLERTPKKFRAALEKKILTKKAGSRDAAWHIAGRLKDRPDAAKEILREDFTGMDEIEVHKRLHEIAPTEMEKVQADADYFERIEKSAHALHDLVLYKNPFKNGKIHFDGLHATSTARTLEDLLKVIPMWLKAYREVEVKGYVTLIESTGEIIE